MHAIGKEDPCPNHAPTFYAHCPQVEELMQAAPMKALEAIVPRSMLVDRARAAVDGQRQLILAGAVDAVDVEAILTDAVNGALATLRPSLRRVINATGVVIHTNLGRSVLAEPAVQAVVEAARGYSTLEYSIENMARGSRHDHAEHLICALTGAEAAIAVNNNAAAVMIVLAEFAAGHEAIVSRGELVEIGGSFRVPDIMAQSNARMVEVGATNKTHAFDYERAITPDTAMLLEGAPLQLPHDRLHRKRLENRPSPHRRRTRTPDAPPLAKTAPSCSSTRIRARAPSCTWMCSANTPSPRCANRLPKDATWSASRATNCSAALRQASSSAARTISTA